MNLLELTDIPHKTVTQHQSEDPAEQKKNILISTRSASITFGLVSLCYIIAAIVTLPGSACTSQSGNLQPYGRHSFVHKIVAPRLGNWKTRA